MAITVALHHLTEYRYARPAALSPHVVRLRPAPHCRTPVLSYSLNIWPRGHFLNWQQDAHGNHLARIVFPERVREFRVEVDLVASMEIYNPFDFFLEEAAETMPFAYSAEERDELAAFLVPPRDLGPRCREFLAGIDFSEPLPTMDFLVDFNRRIHHEVDYLVRMEPGVQAPEETFEKGSGSCRDSAWLVVNLLRSMGYAARFVSGYLVQLTPDVPSLDGPSGPASDFTDLHAWAEIYLPGAGWVGLDATSGLLAAEGHLPLACTPSPPSAAPITGAVEAVESEFSFSMQVSRVAEAPRVTRPYGEDAWERLVRLGREVDGRLEAGDVRLTMGGEPTFVSIDDFDGAEWNTEAVGVAKRRLSGDLLRRLWKRFASGGLLHHGQGKWYPGESLPRWAFTCYWRADGEPLWRRPELLADLEVDYGFGRAEAEAFVRGLAETLGVSAEFTVPAYEDVWYYLWRERNLPVNVDPLDNRLKDPEERARLAAIFEGRIDEPRGWVLPLQRQQPWQARDLGSAGRWRSSRWHVRRDHFYLIPGDSPVGLRLPLDTLPWVSESDYPYLAPVDPTAVAGEAPLPSTRELLERFEDVAQQVVRSRLEVEGEAPAGMPPELRPQAQQPPGEGDGAGDVVRTALCVEPRDGKLFVFMPPVAEAADYFELAAAVEATAAALGFPVVLEGSRPPHDPRVRSFSITPDPGVIEVNVQPARTWDELVEVTETLYDEARLARLGTEKFLLDGRHTGTGGGNHLVLGGATPLDSPFLRRPDVLRSLLVYWQRHPSLSYLFSGLFIGPTSQSPRVDEARDDLLYELEIAFGELDRLRAEPGGATPEPWLVDRLLRHLLTDVTGNTHRAEFCIDKLFSPDSASGRLGLLELRSFEMPPHGRMSLAQQLLMRALVAWFWEKPLESARLVRWGTALHDRLLLPHFVWEDFREVLDDLRREAGFAFEDAWFRAHFEFRFPLYGQTEFRDVRLELRGALEPWHVLGEEGFAGGTVRFVDASVERIEARVSGFFPERFLLACNGRRVPLASTGRAGEHVGGVRYRAWQPSSCLHPTIPVDAPLVFDLVDTWSMRAVAGCTYHVGHPGGRNYETFPVNAYEAESRRLARFTPHGHTPGTLERLPPEERSLEFPTVLDLRLPVAGA